MGKMIPIKLTLRNFMCYRENVPPLSFTGIHTTCICGDNGNGKSALVDAITWAIWGEARTKSQVDLIAQGQSEMSVEFDFAVGNQIYRVIRKYTKPKTRSGSGHPMLEFQVKNGESYRSETGNTVTQTQHKINNTLHMDYDTFVNSAFLRQGHADEFTNREPGQRKEVLATILGLSRYDELETKARESMRIWDDLTSNLQVTINEVITELEQKPDYEHEMVQALSELEHDEKQVKDHDAVLAELRKQYESLAGKQEQLVQLAKYISETQKSIDRWSTQINRHKIRITECEKLIDKRSEIDEGFNRYSSAKKLNDELNGKLATLIKWNESKNKLDMAIEKARGELLQEHAVTQRNITELSSRVDKLPKLKAELQQLEIQQNELGEIEKQLENKRHTYLELRTQIGKTELNLIQLQEQIKEIDEKLSLLSDDNEAKCPLCEQALGLEEHRKIGIKYTNEKKQKQNLIQSSQREIYGFKTEQAKLEKEITQTEIKIKRDRTEIQNRFGLIHHSISEAANGVELLSQEQLHLNEIEQRLAKNEFAYAERQALAALENEITALHYDQAQHEEVKRHVTDLAKYEEAKLKLDEAEKSLMTERESLVSAEKSLVELQDILHNNSIKHQQLHDELDVLPQITADYNNAQTEHQKLVIEERDIREKVVQIREKLKRFEELEIKKSEKSKQVAKAMEEGKIYQELSQAFGKKGIQALLIETAIPEIETEADNLLAKMTDNRMHIKIETQRETKKGNITETLDIRISDELGTRNYEMFSGGEAFRINFAIRIALSRLLAHRAGAPLPTLIIDEGFGTQDSNGIEKLKDAITYIQDEFEKILVITHIEELKDAFSTRIDVAKTGEGATVEVTN